LFPQVGLLIPKIELSSLLVNMRRESQLAVATYLRSAVWNSIDLFPHEFNEAIRIRGKMEGAPERVYDLLSSSIPPSQEKIYWPTLSVLLCCTSDKVRSELVNIAPTSLGRRVCIFPLSLSEAVVDSLTSRNSNSVTIS
jgi:hypothetical protein